MIEPMLGCYFRIVIKKCVHTGISIIPEWIEQHWQTSVIQFVTLCSTVFMSSIVILLAYNYLTLAAARLHVFG